MKSGTEEGNHKAQHLWHTHKLRHKFHWDQPGARKENRGWLTISTQGPLTGLIVLVHLKVNVNHWVIGPWV